MRSITVIILLAFVVQAYAWERVAIHLDSAQNSMDKLGNKLSDRALQTLPLRQAYLDKTTLGKSRHLAIQLNHSPVLPTFCNFAPLSLRCPLLRPMGNVIPHSRAEQTTAKQLQKFPKARSVAPRAAACTEPAVKGAGVEVEDVATFPAPGVSGPGSIAFSPEGDTVTYLISPEGGLRRELRAMNIATGQVTELCKPPSGEGEEENFSLEEKLRRERTRDVFTGITKYAWSEEGGKVLVPIGNELYVQRGLEGKLERIFDVAVLNEGGAKPSSVLDPRMSPDGSLVGFVYDRELYVAPTNGTESPHQLTSGARGTSMTNGLADYVAQEEMERLEGYWISPDSQMVAFTQVDESHIPVYRIVHQGSDTVGEGAEEDHHYPFAGSANPKVKLGVVRTSGGSTTWFDLRGRFGDDDDGYLTRINWLPDGTLLAQVENRLQSRLDLLRLDPSTGKVNELLREESDIWINIHNMCKPLKKSNRLLWASERTGFQHLYLYDLDRMDAQPVQLTSGNWLVEEVVAVSEEEGVVYFMGNEGAWMERHLYEVPLQGGTAPRRITQEDGVHDTKVDTKKGYFVDSFSSATQPLKVNIRSLKDGALVRTLFETADKRLERMNLQPPEFETFLSTDGKVTLQAAIYKPDPARFGKGPYPTLVSTYGGPHVQFVANQWPRITADLRAQYHRSRGYLIIKVDNRGSSRRGLEFEGAVKHDMGNLEIADQVAGVQHFVQKGLCDPTRVGIYGWSYGGYMSAMALVKEPKVFQAAVSGAPVTHWDGYDTHYTERYMGTPQINPEGYNTSAVMKHVDSLEGHLMLVHGLIDENVHFRHTARLINALIKARKPYELLLFPDERHLPRSLPDRIYMEERIAAFLDRSLNAGPCKA